MKTLCLIVGIIIGAILAWPISGHINREVGYQQAASDNVYRPTPQGWNPQHTVDYVSGGTKRHHSVSKWKHTVDVNGMLPE